MSTDTHTPLYLFDEAMPQPQHTFETVSIRNLINDRELYDYPPLQRNYAWPKKFCRAFIDSILRGYPIHPFLVYKEVDVYGVEKNWVLDGKQRYSTICAYREGKFATSTDAEAKRDEPNSLRPIEAGRRFYELSERSQNLFLAYKFIINVTSVTDDARRGQIFRRVQHQIPLKAAERLASYTSEAKDYALQLCEDLIWSDLYIGPRTRKEALSGSLSLIYLELTQGYAHIDNRQLERLVSGVKDKLITPKLREAIEERLEVVRHAFHGITFSHRTDIVIMYQAVMFLEKQGYVFEASDKGRLAPWLGQVLNDARHNGKNGFAYSIAKLVESVDLQRDFWNDHLPRILKLLKESPEEDLALVD